MDDQFSNLLATLGAIAAVAIGYAKVFAPYQFQIAEWVIEARQIKSRNKGLVNFAVGVALALALSAFAAWQAADWSLLAVGALAGIMASVEAAKVHDQESAAETGNQA
jgi:urea transporter